ncbi:MAG TPA: lamin tail domain-containing protein [Chloroflexota bacterium]|nr:lamin tail domain-containing protein [Chloroflexota bacterium]
MPPAAPAGRLLINEVLTSVVPGSAAGSPLGETWVELFAPSGGVDTSGWTISAGGVRAVLPHGTTVSSHGYLVLYKHETLLELGATPLIAVTDAAGNPVDSVQPPLTQPGQTYARIPDGSSWAVTNVPTPGSPNTLVAPVSSGATTATGGSGANIQATINALQTVAAAPLPTVPADPSSLATAIAEAANPDAFELAAGVTPKKSRKGEQFQQLSISAVRQLPDGSPVITSGIVTLPSGTYDAARGYIQQASAGLLVHLQAGTLPAGQLVTVKGRVHHTSGELEVATVAGGLTVGGSGELSPRDVAIADIGANTEAQLVRVSGVVLARGRDYVTLGDDAGAAARVYLYPHLGIPASRFTVQQALAVSGVVNHGASGWRLLPRDERDFTGALAASGTPLSSAESARNHNQPLADDVAAFLSATPFITPVTDRATAMPTVPTSQPAVVPTSAPSRMPASPRALTLTLIGIAFSAAGVGSGIGVSLLWRHLHR